MIRNPSDISFARRLKAFSTFAPVFALVFSHEHPMDALSCSMSESETLILSARFPARLVEWRLEDPSPMCVRLTQIPA